MKGGRNTAIGCFGLLALLVGFFVVWVSGPRIADPAYYKDNLQEAANRFAAIQGHAFDQDENAFQHKEFQKFWGREGQEFQNNSEFQVTIQHWNAHYSSWSSGEKLDQQALLNTSDKRKQEARAEFLAVLPELKRVLNRPYFVTPAPKWDLETVAANLAATRAVAIALSGYCEQLAAVGHYQELAEVVGTLVHFGGILESGGSLLDSMISVAVQAIAFETTVVFLTPETELSPETWGNLGASFRESLGHPDAYFRATQTEMLRLENGWAQVRKDESSPVLLFPGMMERERRILINAQVNILKATKTGTLSQYQSSRAVFTWPNYFSGADGIISSSYLLGGDRAASILTLHRKKMVGLATCAELFALRDRAGNLPRSLEGLSADLRSLPDWSALKVEYIVNKGLGVLLRIPLTPSEVDQIPNFTSIFGETWVRVELDHLVFELARR